MNPKDHQLQQCSAFQQVLLNLATSFINQPIEQVDETIIQALGRIAEFFGAMDCAINRFSEDRSRCTRLYQWMLAERPPTYAAEATMLDNFGIKVMQHLGEMITVADMPEQGELATFLRSYGIATIMTISILENHQLFGFISISWDKPKQLDPQIIGLLPITGDIFLNALNRKRKDEAIRNFSVELEHRVAQRTAELVRVNDQMRGEIAQREGIEQVLRHSEVQLRSILDSSPISMLVVNPGGDVLYVNQVCASLFGIDALAPSNYNVGSFYADTADRVELRKVLENQGFVKDREIPIRKLDGSVRFGLVSSRPFQYAAESAFLVAIVDVTDLRRTQVSEEEHRNVTEALLDSAVALTSTLQLDEVVKHILRSVYLVARHDVANLMVLEGHEALVIGSRDYVAGSLDYTLVTTRFDHREDYVVTQMSQTHQPVIIPDINDEPRFKRISKGPVLRGYLGIPIIVGQELIGLISLGSQTPDFFTETHAKYLKIFAIQAGIAIQNARLYEQAKTIAALEERQRLARELHDSVTQTLFSANTLAEALPRVMQQNPQKGLHYLHDLHQLTRGAMAEMRSLLIELRPESIARTELGVLLTQLCDVFTGNTQIDIIRVFNKQIVLPSDLQLAFYRVAQEALSNIAKHSKATHVQLELFSADDMIEMRIRDNGQGFDLEQVSANRFGLSIMKERAANIRAEFKISSQIGSGTEISLKRYLLR